MSTRATVHFVNQYEKVIIYRHSDGYPEGLGNDLETFFDAVKQQTEDTRFDDPSYLAAKFVVWQADIYAKSHAQYGGTGHMLDFLGVGVVQEDPGDIEYRYIVSCQQPRPIVKCEKV